MPRASRLPRFRSTLYPRPITATQLATRLVITALKSRYSSFGHVCITHLGANADTCNHRDYSVVVVGRISVCKHVEAFVFPVSLSLGPQDQWNESRLNLEVPALARKLDKKPAHQAKPAKPTHHNAFA